MFVPLTAAHVNKVNEANSVLPHMVNPHQCFDDLHV